MAKQYSRQFRDQMGRFARQATEKQRETARAGGKARGEQRKQQAEFRDLMRQVDAMPMKSEAFMQGLRQLGIPDDVVDTLTQKWAKVFALQRRCLRGDPKAIELWLKITGEYEETVNHRVTQRFDDMVLGD